jgi:K+ transporter
MIKLPLMITGFIQVYFVSINTCFLAKGMYAPVLLAAFMISWIWTFNVKSVAFGTHIDRLIYATGAALGSISGLASSDFVITIINKI